VADINANAKSPEEENAESAVIENSKWVDGVLWSMLLAATAIILLKLIGKQDFKWQDVELNTSQAWVVFSILTLAHFYAAVLLLKSIRRVWQLSDRLSRSRLFGKITSTGGIFVRGLVARTECRQTWFLSVSYEMDHHDPSAWFAQFSVPLLITAITPFAIRRTSLRFFLLGVVLGEINWIIGSHWIIALSDLSTESHSNDWSKNAEGSEGSLYFRKLDRAGIRMIGIQSGGNSFDNVEPLVLPLWFTLNCILKTVTFPFRIALFCYYGLRRSRAK